MEDQVYHIQKLLADELDKCKGKENNYAERYIKKIQDIYKQENIIMKEQDTKGKQWIQNKEVLLYKPYKANSPKPKTPKPTFIQNKIANLKKYIKFMQAPIQTTLFYLPSHYKSLWLQGEQDKQYWKEITIVFLEKKYNADTTRKGFSIKMYVGGPPHKPYFIMLTLQRQIIIGPIKKLVGDLILLD